VSRHVVEIHQFQGIGILDSPLRRFAQQRATIAEDIDQQQRTLIQGPGAEQREAEQQAGINHDPWPPFHTLRLGQAAQLPFRSEADQALRRAYPVHDLIAGIDAESAVDALVLQAIANIDAGRTNLDADAAIDAVAGIGGRMPGAARFAALPVVARVGRRRVEHDALETRVRAHVLTDRLAGQSGLNIGEGGVENQPEGFPGPGVEGLDGGQQIADRREIADEGNRGPQRDDPPQAVLDGLAPKLVDAHRRLVELQSGQVVAFHPGFDPGEDHRIYGLRTGKAAKQPPGQRGDQEQRGRRQDQHEGQQQGILRPEDEAEQVELFVGDIEQDGLTFQPVAFPGQPAGAVENDLGDPDHRPAQRVEPAGNGLGVDFPFFPVELQLGFANLADGLVHVSLLIGG